MIKKRNPFIAFILSFISAGTGQLYNGDLKKGLIIYTIKLFLIFIVGITGLQYSFHGLAIIIIISILFSIYILVDAIVVASKKKNMKLQNYQKWYVYLSLIALALVVSLTFNNSKLLNIKLYNVTTTSMETTLHINDHVLVDTKHKNYSRGNIIAFNKNGKVFIKRIIGLGGEHIKLIKGKVFINDHVLEENYTHIKSNSNFSEVVIPKRSFFVLGDNRNNSFDSRMFGTISKDKIIGKVRYIYFPFNKIRNF